MKKPSHYVIVDTIIRQFIPIYDQPSQELALDQCCSRFNTNTLKPVTLRYVANGENFLLKKSVETRINYISVHDADEE